MPNFKTKKIFLFSFYFLPHRDHCLIGCWWTSADDDDVICVTKKRKTTQPVMSIIRVLFTPYMIGSAVFVNFWKCCVGFVQIENEKTNAKAVPVVDIDDDWLPPPPKVNSNAQRNIDEDSTLKKLRLTAFYSSSCLLLHDKHIAYCTYLCISSLYWGKCMWNYSLENWHDRT